MKLRETCLVAAMAALIPAAAAAQGQPSPTPRLPPENPKSPLDFAPGRLPGATAPAPPASGAGAGASATKPPPAGYEGGDMTTVTPDRALYTTPGSDVKPIPKAHVVKEGDTLWEIARTYYGDPWQWPKIWAENPDITNPHWIYPGDTIALPGGGAAKPTLGRRPARERLQAVLTGTRVYEKGPLRIHQRAFVDTEEIAGAGRVAGANTERTMLSQHDIIYVEGGNIAAGKRYTVYRPRKRLERGDTPIGQVVEVLGTVEVGSRTSAGVARARVISSMGPIRRGDRVGPVRRTLKTVPARPAGANARGRIVATLREGELFATNDFVVVDIGTRQGVRPGNRVVVVRRGDAHKRLLQERADEDDRFPAEATAEILVLDARADASVGLVTRATREVDPEAYVYLRKGY